MCPGWPISHWKYIQYCWWLLADRDRVELLLFLSSWSMEMKDYALNGKWCTTLWSMLIKKRRIIHATRWSFDTEMWACREKANMLYIQHPRNGFKWIKRQRRVSCLLFFTCRLTDHKAQTQTEALSNCIRSWPDLWSCAGRHACVAAF